jgi:hypothetical protein
MRVTARITGAIPATHNDCEEQDMTTYTYTIKQDGEHVPVAVLHGPRGLSPAAARQRLLARIDRGVAALLAPCTRESLLHADVHRAGGAA